MIRITIGPRRGGLLILVVLMTACESGGPMAPGPPEDGASSPPAEAVPVPRPVSGVVAVSIDASPSHTCALTVEGQAYCWGEDWGQLGGPVESGRAPTPVRVGGDREYVSIATSEGTTCAVAADTRVYCWGWRYSHDPVSVSEPGFATVYGGLRDHYCALTDAGEAFCWGSNRSGKLGTAAVDTAAAPTAVAGGHRFVKLALGGEHSCGLSADGAVWCWGSNILGELGHPPTGGWSSQPLRVETDVPVLDLSAGSFDTCAVARQGEAYCWGAADGWKTGTGTSGTLSYDDVPTPVVGSYRFASISAGTTHTCALTPEGRTYCWGAGDWGQVGLYTDRCSTLWGGSYPCARTPQPAATGFDLVEVRVGTRHTCGRQADGRVVCWGESTFIGSLTR